MSTSGMPGTVRRGSSFRDRAGTYVRARAARSGRAPRNAYTHYFIESEGLHSRIHLQNFWSTFWPQVEEPSVAHVRAFAAGPAGGRARVLVMRGRGRFGKAVRARPVRPCLRGVRPGPPRPQLGDDPH